MDKNEGTSKRNLRRSPGISYDEILEGHAAVRVYATYATYAPAGLPTFATAFPAFLPAAARSQPGLS
ncbi:MAG: hypothetical protein OXE52_07435, partial [Chloroflexi bacterium]|nr:hypothetical protein [Chloroflexota bacterium]